MRAWRKKIENFFSRSFFKDKKARMIVVGVLLIFVVIFGVRFFSGDEDTWVCDDGIWVKHGSPRGAEPQTVCPKKNNTSSEILKTALVRVTTSSPETLHCVANNGKIEFRSRGDGKQFQVCVFPGGRECEVNSYAEEQCPRAGAPVAGLKTQPAYYCVLMGGEYRPTKGVYYKTLKEQGTCVFLNGRSCSASDFWNGICEKSVPTAKELQKPMTVSVTDAITKTDFLGTVTTTDPLISKYGETPEAIFKKNPTLLTLIRKLLPTFDVVDMRRNFAPLVAEFPDKQKLLIFGGCNADGCSGTTEIAAYDPKKKRAYLLREDATAAGLDVYGIPEDMFTRALFSIYFSLE